MSAAPGTSGGEGGGFGKDVTLAPATLADPILKTTVGLPTNPPTGDDPASRCIRLSYQNFHAIPNAPTQLTTAKVGPSAIAGVGVCTINGYIAPQVGFRLLMPLEDWNGKYLQTGCGGQCGDILTNQCEALVDRGYACMANDLGHKGTTYDDVWAVEDVPAQIDFAFRATHVSAVVGKVLTAAYYGKPPRRAYFIGASTGGIQALHEAQQFPDDFDGIVAGEPGYNKGVVYNTRPPTETFAARDLIAPDGKPKFTADELRMVNRYVVSKCDMQDGVKDGLFPNPRSCPYDPAELQCGGARKDSCLSAEQVGILRRVYAGQVDEKTGIHLNFGPSVGSEIRWIGTFVTETGEVGRAKSRPRINTYPYTAVFNFNTNPDLRPFKAAGGKMILYVGWMEEGSADKTIDYYQTVERVMGGREKTQDFLRLFTIPGQSHIPGGPGAESTDYLTVLDAWVEGGKAPEVIVGHKLKWISQMMGPIYLEKDLQEANYLYSRPHYPWPIEAHYRGKGDPTQASSFGPWDPAKRAWAK